MENRRLKHWRVCTFASVFASAWTFLGLAFAVNIYLQYAHDGDPVYWWQALGMGLCFWYSWAFISLLAYLLVRRLPISSKRLFIFVVVHGVAGVAFAFLKMTMDYPVIYCFYCPTPELLTFERFFPMAFRSQFGKDVLISWIILGFAHLLEYYRLYRGRELQTSQMEARLAQANLQILKMQVQPSLLVSTLSAISSKMHEDVEATDGMITRLGDLLRLTLDKADSEQVALREELEGLEAYLGIEQARLGPDFVARTDVDPRTLDARVPFFLLQPVVEEAIRHALDGAEKRGQVTVRARCTQETLRFHIEAEAKGAMNSRPHVLNNGNDLANTQTRLRQLYGKHFVLEASNGTPGHFRITIELPFEESIAA